MATQQLVSISQKPMHAASYGDRRSKSSPSHHLRTRSREQIGGAMNEKLWKAKLQRRHQSGDTRLLGFKYLAYSVSCMIMSKAKAICNQVFRDFFKKTPEVGNEVMLVDPYFSIPVVPATGSTPYV